MSLLVCSRKINYVLACFHFLQPVFIVVLGKYLRAAAEDTRNLPARHRPPLPTFPLLLSPNMYTNYSVTLYLRHTCSP